MSKLLRLATTRQITGFLHGGDMPGTKWNKQHRPGVAPISHNCIVSRVCHHFTVIFYYHFTPIVLRLLYHRRTTARVYTAPSQLGLSPFSPLLLSSQPMSSPPCRQACAQLTCSATSCSVRTLQLHPSILVPWVPCTAMPNSSSTAPSCSVQLTGSSPPLCACHLPGLGAPDGLGADFGPA